MWHLFTLVYCKQQIQTRGGRLPSLQNFSTYSGPNFRKRLLQYKRFSTVYFWRAMVSRDSTRGCDSAFHTMLTFIYFHKTNKIHYFNDLSYINQHFYFGLILSFVGNFINYLAHKLPKTLSIKFGISELIYRIRFSRV